MAILWMDNFNIYGTDSGATARLLNGVYAENNSSVLSDDPDPTATGKVICLPPSYGGGGNYTHLRKVLPASKSTVGQALRMWLAALPSAADITPAPITFKDASNNFLACLCVTNTGRLEVRQGGIYGTVLAASTNPVVTANAWYHLEMKYVASATVGSIEVRVEGVTVLQATNINTTATQVAQVELANDPSGSSVGVSMYVKDFIIWDSTTDFNNDFMGSCQVLKSVPDADVALNWTPNPADGIGYDKINETTPDDDTRYIGAPYPGIPAPYKCSFTDLPVTVTSVRGVMTIHRSRKSDGGDGNLQVGLISGANTGLGADRAITTAYTYWWDIFDADPNGAIAWTRSAVNALNMQINRTL